MFENILAVVICQWKYNCVFQKEKIAGNSYIAINEKRARVEGTDRLEVMFLGKDRYMIPTYQRGYSWETEHVNELLQDLEYAHDAENEVYEHFFGTVLITNPKMPLGNMIKVIDGQQRLTTVVVFLVCARNFFLAYDKKPEAKKHCERLEEYIYKGGQSPVLVLSRTNKKLFEEIMEPRTLMETLPGTHSESNDSNELLTNAYKIIRNWIKELDKGDPDLAIKTLYGYVRTLFEKFVIYKYHYNEEAKAYAVFNLVNNRGIDLNESDLIKNYLFGEMADRGIKEEELDGCDERWDEMRQNVTGKKNAAYQLDRFFYHYLLTFYSNKIPKNKKIDSGGTMQLKQKEIHEAFRNLVGGKKVEPKTIIKDMERWSSILTQLRNPTKDEFARSHILHYLEKIKDVKAVFVYPAILAGYKEYWLKKEYDQFEALVMMCFKYHVRVKVIGTSMSVSSYQSIMYEITDEINQGKTIKTIINDLVKKEEKYPADERVLQNLQELRVSNSKLAIALLEEAEYGYNEERSLGTVSVEHIMPKSFKAWERYIEHHNTTSLSPAEFHDQYFSLLGNQTLLSRTKNTSASNRLFSDKQRDYYANENTYKITKKLSSEKTNVWNGDAIKARQDELAETILWAINLPRIIEKCRL